MPRASALLATLTAGLMAATAASAATVTENVTFSAPFSSPNYGGGTYPYPASPNATPSSVTGSFTITFDPTQTYLDDTAGITNAVLNGVTSDSVFAFDYSPNSYSAGGNTFEAGELVVGGLNDGACCVVINSLSPPPIETVNDFYLQILGFTGADTFNQFGYTTSSGDYFYTLNGSAGGSDTVTQQVQGVPEPSTWALMLMGLLGLAWLACRNRKAGSSLV